jgi:hypothetical protein
MRLRLGRFWLDLDLWLRGWLAVQRLILAAIILAGESYFRAGLKLLFAQEFVGIQKFVSITEEVALLSLTTWLLIEALRIFLPSPWGITLDLDVETKPIDKPPNPS